MRNITKSTGLTQKDLFNASNAVTLETAKGSTIDVVGCALGESTDESTGEVKNIGYIKDISGQMYCTISATAIGSINDIMALFNVESEPVKVAVEPRQSKGGREFIVLVMQ